MSLKTKTQTLSWFLKRPALYSQMGYLAYQRIFPHPKEETRLESTRWCEKNRIAASDAILHVTGRQPGKPLTELFPDFFHQAQHITGNLLFTMGGGADMDLLYYLTEYSKTTVAIETGVAYGWSSAAVLLSLKNRAGSMLYSTDMPYPKLNNEPFVGCVVPEELKVHWQIANRPDRNALPRIIRSAGSIDLCHYDSDKSYRGRMWAYPKLWAALKDGGIFISDDINDNLGFKDFAEKVKTDPLVVFHEPEQKYIGILVKRN